jgi:hypothetical protein
MKHRVNQMLMEINPALILADPIADLLVDAIIGQVTASKRSHSAHCRP